MIALSPEPLAGLRAGTGRAIRIADREFEQCLGLLLRLQSVQLPSIFRYRNRRMIRGRKWKREMTPRTASTANTDAQCGQKAAHSDGYRWPTNYL